MDKSFFKKNLGLLEKHHPELFKLTIEFATLPSSLNLKTEASRAGHLTLSAIASGGARIYLHSKYDPVKEAKKIVASQGTGKTDSTVILLGFGLGYLPMAIAEQMKTEQALFIADSSITIFHCAMEHTDLAFLLARPNTIFLLGDDFLSVIKKRFATTDFKMEVIAHKPSLQLFPELNEAVCWLDGITLPNLKKELHYSKFRLKLPKILLFESGFFIEKELKNTFNKLGIPHKTLSIDQSRKEGQAGFIQKLMGTLAEFKPDVILTINFWGFDREGKLSDILTHFEVPFACWFVDNPLPLIERKNCNASEVGTYFLWDRHYISELEKLGFPNVRCLPYAADTTIFYPPRIPVTKKYPLSFVGNSLTTIIEMRLNEIRGEKELTDIYNKLETNYPPLSSPVESIDLITREIGVKNFKDKDLASLEVAVNSRRTQRHRVEALLSLEKYKPHIFGDRGWRDLLPSSFNIHPEVNYHKELADVYCETEINLNISNVQLKNSVNQRLFDVCACGSFLLTDKNPALDPFLEPVQVVEAFETLDHLGEKVDFYLKNPEERRKIEEKGKKTIAEHHTYSHRIKEILSILEKQFG